MPLEPGKSTQAFKHNVATEVRAGKPAKQAVAIAYSEKERTGDEMGSYAPVKGTISSLAELNAANQRYGSQTEGETTYKNQPELIVDALQDAAQEPTTRTNARIGELGSLQRLIDDPRTPDRHRKDAQKRLEKLLAKAKDAAPRTMADDDDEGEVEVQGTRTNDTTFQPVGPTLDEMNRKNRGEDTTTQMDLSKQDAAPRTMADDDDEGYIYTCITKDGVKHEIEALNARHANTIAERRYGYANISVPPQESLKKKTADEHEGFAKVERSVAHEKGVKDPAALAAAIGRKKYGAAEMAEKAAASRVAEKGR